MKKILLISGGILLFILVSLAVIPLLFKPAIVEKAKLALNNRINATVEFEDLNISLIKSFPNASIELKNVSVTGRGEFENDTLLVVKNATAKMGLMSLFRNSERKIDEIVLNKPELKLVIGESENANWVITKMAETVSDKSSENNQAEEPFSLQLNAVKIKNGGLQYIDRSINLAQIYSDINVDLTGKMYGSSTELMLEGGIEKVTIDYDGIRYISNVSVETSSRLNVDYEKMDILIAENELLLNRLPMEVTGLIQVPSDSMIFDLNLKTKNSDFENFFALMPPAYEKYLEGLKTSGSAAVSGTVKGIYFKEIYPAVDLKIELGNGTIQYEDLPEEIRNISAEIAFSKPEGEMNLSVLKVENAHLEIGENPLDLTLLLNNLFTDPYFDGAFVGKINFNELKKAFPLDSVNIAGTIDANLFAKGNYSAVENEQYEKIKSDGIVLLDNFMYDSPVLTQKIFVPEGELTFSPENVTLSRLAVNIGQSKLNLTGKVSGYLNYLLKDGVLKGDLRLVSSFVNLNELLRLQKEKVESDINQNAQQDLQTAATEPEKLVFDVPLNLDIRFRSDIENALLNNFRISNINGVILAQSGRLELNGLKMNMFEGSMKLTGSYQNTPQNQPLVNFGLDVAQFDIPTAFRTLSGLRRMMPVAEQSQGKLNTSVKINGRMTESFTIIPASVSGSGNFGTTNLVIANSPVFQQLKGIIRPELLQNVAIDDFNANVTINNGNIDLKPFATKVAGQETTVSGALSAENIMNMRLDFKVRREAFGPDIQNILSVIPGNQKLTVLPAGVEIKGPVNDAGVKVDLSETQKVVTDAAKSELKNSLEQLGSGLKKLFK